MLGTIPPSIPDLDENDNEAKVKQFAIERKQTEVLIESFTKKRKEDRKNRIVDGHILDDYISVLSYLHQTQRFKRFFDPIRLRMHLITPE